MSRTSIPTATSVARAWWWMLLLSAVVLLWLGSSNLARATSEGATVTTPGPKWLDFFCIGNEQCIVGDFDGDGKEDVAVLYRDTRSGIEQGDVLVARSLGDRFDTPQKWSDMFCTGSQVCKVGDFNGDGKDDLIAFNPQTSGNVLVALSTGTSFNAPTTWHAFFCLGNEVCDVGDFNGDHRDDIVLFKRNAYTGDAIGDVVVALSTGFGFGLASKWQEFFCILNETCGVGDFNGDNADDIIAFAKGSNGKVYVALSNRASFAAGSEWNAFFCVGNETCAVGDFTGDGKEDILTFLGGGYGGGSEGDVYVAVSKGGGFGDGWLWHGDFCLAGEVCTVGDFNGDGRKDVVRFLRDTRPDDSRGDVYVALAAGQEGRFLAAWPSGKWHESFCGPNEVCATGDVNGDGLDDVITFVRNAQAGSAAGDVLVALSSGTGFGLTQKWHDNFCAGDEICKVGDVNGDGRADILAFVRSAGPVWVALSTGSSFGVSSIWHNFFCVGQEICEVGDVNGDRYADIIAFLRGTNPNDPRTGDVFVALSTGAGFGPAAIWNGFFCVGDEVCKVGDVNGDGRADILAFVRGTAADVFVGLSLSTGTSFATGTKWHDFFCAGVEVCEVGDFNGDGRSDVITFLRNGYDTTTAGDVYVGLSTGGRFSAGPKWHDFFCVGDEVCGVGDFNGDGADDVIAFTRGTAMDVYVALSNRSTPYFRYLLGPLQNPIWLPIIRR
ncbi:MAG: FG-GAP repeat domain-containing protein [Anaerolineae bacterium]